LEIGDNEMRLKINRLIFFSCGALLPLFGLNARADDEPNAPAALIQNLSVNGRLVQLNPAGLTKLPPSSTTITFTIGTEKRETPRVIPVRMRFKLEGYDPSWHEIAGQGRLIVGFLNEVGGEISRTPFLVNGQSVGWTGKFETSPGIHSETNLVVPSEASGFRVAITSAGAPGAIGAFVVSDLTIKTVSSSNEPSRMLLRFPLNPDQEQSSIWMQEGIIPSMAQMVTIGPTHHKQALAIVDDSPFGHAQWSTLRSQSPLVVPGEKLVIKWDEAFSLGTAMPQKVEYRDLKAGLYRFFVERLNLMGLPTGEVYSINFEVAFPFWESPWFWVAAFTGLAAALVLFRRFRFLRRLQAENFRLAYQQTLERERFRIAEDIHDDLGARVTQISLASALAEKTAADPVASRAGFQNITQMARSLVSSLYDTIWVVNPENDNLEAVGNYLCQMVNQLTEQAGLRCRLEVPNLPSNLPVTSHQRHNLSMALKESVHNVIKHAAANEVRMKITWDNSELNVYLHDDGSGFDPNSIQLGRGLENIGRRLEHIGGRAEVSRPQGGGTMVHLRMPIQPLKNIALT
jgi:signal transduction histidine kinase